MPHIHGRLYAVIDAWTLPSREFRILVASPAVTGDSIQDLLDIDALAVFLRSQQHPPCHLRFFSAGPDQERVAGLTSPVTPLKRPPQLNAIASVRDAFGEIAVAPLLAEVLAHGLEARVDVVVPEVVPTDPSPTILARRLNLSLCNWSEAKHACEVFVRGHEVPWAFGPDVNGFHGWGQPWLGLYPLTEHPHRLNEVQARAQGSDWSTRELLRSLIMNRHPALAFTRDRLLFYVQQQRTARRFGYERQEFMFECDYYLNHYYLLLWGGLDQLCWIMSGICQLGFGKRDHGKVGIARDAFHRALLERAPRLHAVVTDEKFVAWRKVIASARHLAAHRGITTPSEVFQAPETELTAEALDVAIEASEEWKQTVRVLGQPGAESARWLFRVKEQRRRMKKMPERMLPVEIDGRQGFIAPLVNIQYDFDQFMVFANSVAVELLGHIESQSGGS